MDPATLSHPAFVAPVSKEWVPKWTEASQAPDAEIERFLSHNRWANPPCKCSTHTRTHGRSSYKKTPIGSSIDVKHDPKRSPHATNQEHCVRPSLPRRLIAHLGQKRCHGEGLHRALHRPRIQCRSRTSKTCLPTLCFWETSPWFGITFGIQWRV